MVHNQTNANRNGNDHLTCRPPTVLLDNGSMVHNQANPERNRNYCASDHVTFPVLETFSVLSGVYFMHDASGVLCVIVIVCCTCVFLFIIAVYAWCVLFHFR